jgi:hypothetical protein
MKTIFISYCHKDSKFADTFCEYSKNSFTIRRDIRDLNYGDSIKEYIKNIRNTYYSLIIISDDYLKSENCMYEVLEFTKDDNYKEKILPIIIGNAKIFNEENRLLDIGKKSIMNLMKNVRISI